MSEEQDTIQKEIIESFSAVLNRNGYGFQYSVLKKLNDLAKLKKSSFNFEVSEFPVQVNGVDTRIDFILRKYWDKHWQDSLNSTFLIAECKRVNPAYSNWFFTKSPYLVRNQLRHDNKVIIETLVREYEKYQGIEFLRKEKQDAVKKMGFIDRNYHLGFDVKTNKKGDCKGEMGDAIERACGQVLRGLNGLKNLCLKNLDIWEGESQIHFIPVIFTTADLFVSEKDISIADIETGHLDFSDDEVKKVDWLYYQYPVSNSLTAREYQQKGHTELEEFLYTNHIRTIAIVNQNGIEDFIYKHSFEF